MKFQCVPDCSQCCIEREYFPSKEYGKIGVLILPEEKDKIEQMAKHKGITVSIIPRIGISNYKDDKPNETIAYQMMGREKNGNTCPFLDTESDERTEHGGHLCKIYQNRPLACVAYPLEEIEPTTLDQKCKFCKERGNADTNLDAETESLLYIKAKMKTDADTIWRYATGVGEEFDKAYIKKGWIKEIQYQKKKAAKN